jgi:hypothetical protein
MWMFSLTKRFKNYVLEIKKAVTEVAKSYADNITGKVKFGNEAILIVGKK